MKCDKEQEPTSNGTENKRKNVNVENKQSRSVVSLPPPLLFISTQPHCALHLLLDCLVVIIIIKAQGSSTEIITVMEVRVHIGAFPFLSIFIHCPPQPPSQYTTYLH